MTGITILQWISRATTRTEGRGGGNKNIYQLLNEDISLISFHSLETFLSTSAKVITKYRVSRKTLYAFYFAISQLMMHR